MKGLLRVVDRTLFEEYRASAEDLAIFRVLFAAYTLLSVLPAGLWIRHLPDAAFSPPMSLAAFFRHYPPHSMMVALNALTTLFTCTLLIGYRTALSSVAVAVGLVLVHSFAYADGKIDNDILVVLVPLSLAGSGWGARFSLDARRSPPDANATAHQAWLSATLALLIGLAFLSAGLAKARGGWLSLDTLATRFCLLPNIFVTGRGTPLATWTLDSLPVWAWKLADLATVLWECTFVLAVQRRTLFRLYCAIGVLFHFSVWQLFGITVAVNVAAYGAFVSWGSLLKRSALLAWKPSRTSLVALGTLPFVVGFAKLFLFDDTLRERMEAAMEGLVLVAGVPTGIGYLAFLAKAAMRAAGSASVESTARVQR